MTTLNVMWVCLLAYVFVIITSYLINRNKITFSFINWVRPSFEGADGKSSYRALSAFVLLILICYKVAFDKSKTDVDLNIIYSLEATFLLLTSVISIQNVITLWRGSTPTPEDHESIKPGDKVTVTGKIEQP